MGISAAGRLHRDRGTGTRENGGRTIPGRRSEAQFGSFAEDFFQDLRDDACVFIFLEFFPEAEGHAGVFD